MLSLSLNIAGTDLFTERWYVRRSGLGTYVLGLLWPHVYTGIVALEILSCPSVLDQSIYFGQGYRVPLPHRSCLQYVFSLLSSGNLPIVSNSCSLVFQVYLSECSPPCRLVCPPRRPLYRRCPLCSPARGSPLREAGAGAAGGQDAPGAGRNGGGNARDARDQQLTSNGIRGNEKGKEAERGDENGGGSDRARRGSGSRAESAASTATNGGTSGATSAAARESEAAGPSRSGGTPERGTKRLSEVEPEAAAAAVGGGSGAGERGAVGRPRGKMPRGRSHSSHTSSTALAVSPLGPAAVAVEGRGAGSSGVGTALDSAQWMKPTSRRSRSREE